MMRREAPSCHHAASALTSCMAAFASWSPKLYPSAAVSNRLAFHVAEGTHVCTRIAFDLMRSAISVMPRRDQGPRQPYSPGETQRRSAAVVRSNAFSPSPSPPPPRIRYIPQLNPQNPYNPRTAEGVDRIRRRDDPGLPTIVDRFLDANIASGIQRDPRLISTQLLPEEVICEVQMVYEEVRHLENHHDRSITKSTRNNGQSTRASPLLIHPRVGLCSSPSFSAIIPMSVWAFVVALALFSSHASGAHIRNGPSAWITAKYISSRSLVASSQTRSPCSP